MIEDELLAAITEALHTAEAGIDLIDVLAAAATAAVRELGYTRTAGHEYGIQRGDITEALGFNTEEQARLWAGRNIDGPYIIERRPVGLWEGIT